jgi:hypothetical protein
VAALKAGGMGDSGVVGKPLEFAGSLAEAIENALNGLLSQDGITPFPVDDNSRETRDRRRLFVAIAQGIVNYLDANDDALVILSPPGPGGTRAPTGEIIEITTA